DNPAKRRVKGIGDRDDKLNEPSSAASCQQRQQKPHPEQCVDYPEDVIDDLRDSCEPARTLHFALSFNDLGNRLRTKLTSDLIDSLRFTWRRLYGGAFTNFRLDVGFDLSFYRVVLCRPPCFFDR